MEKKDQKGFTLVELLVVIAILAILATISVTGYTSFIKKSAITTDESLVEQLNRHRIAYEVENGPINEENLSNMLNYVGLSELHLNSAEYGYAVYFNTRSEKFELLIKENADSQDHLIKITESMFENGSDDNTENNDNDQSIPDDDTGEGTEGGDNNNNNTGSGSDDTNNENQGDQGQGDQNEPVAPEGVKFTINPEALPNSSTQAYAQYDETSGELNVYVSIDYDPDELEYYTELLELDLDSFITCNKENSIIEFKCNPLSFVTYEGYDTLEDGYSISNNSTIKFTKIGTYELTYTCENVSESVIVNVYNNPKNYQNASFSKPSRKIFVVKYASSASNAYAVTIDPLCMLYFDDYYIYNTDLVKNPHYKSDMSDEYQDLLFEDKRIYITMDGNNIPCDIDSPHHFYIDNLEKGYNTIDLTLNYRGYNGVWISASLTIKIQIKDSGPEFVSIYFAD